VFMFGGVAAGRLQHTSAILCYGLFPLALLLLQLALDRCSIALAAAFAVVASMLALGRNQVALLFCFVLLLWVLAEIVMAERPLRYLRERLPVLITMAVIGVLIVAAPVLLTMQFAALSNRPMVDVDTALKTSLHPANLAQLVVANIFGTQAAYWGPGPSTVPEIAYTDESFNYMFVGAIPVLLLLWFGVVGGRAFRRGRLLFTAAIVLALLYALGRYSPLFPFAFEWVPGVSRFRRPADADFVVMAAFALLAGQLLADYAREGPPPRRLLASIAVAAAALAIVAWGVAFSARTGHAQAALVEILKTAPIPIAAILVLAFARTPRARTVAAVLVTAAAVADLLWWNAAFRLNAEIRGVYSVLERPWPLEAQALDVVERAVRQRQLAGERPRIEVLGLGGPWQNAAMVHGLEATNGYNPLRIGLYDRLVSPGEGNWLTVLRDFPASFDGYDCALARALGLEFLVLGRPIEEVPHLKRRPVADVLQAGPKAWIYRLRDPAPRLNFTTRVQVAVAGATNGSGQLLASPSSDHALIDRDTPPARSYGGKPGASAGQARIVAWQADRVEIETMSEIGGVLVLHDGYYPGWQAQIDGRGTAILRADVLFRAVEVPAGAHRVVFRFVPFSFANLQNALMQLLH
jgi:Bacterial membrane protein YfhO